MSFDRNSLLAGPCIVTQGGGTFYAEKGVKCNVDLNTFPLSSDAAGKYDERVQDVDVMIEFVPAGEWEAAALTALYTQTTPVIGSRLLGSSDVPCVIWPIDSKEKLTFTSSGIWKMPDLEPAALKTIFGQVGIRCMGKNSAAWSATDKRVTNTATASFVDSSFTIGNVRTTSYAIALGALSSPWNDIKTKSGTKISFALQWKPCPVDGEGNVDYMLAGLDTSVKLQCVGPTVAEAFSLLKFQGAGARQGMSLSANANDLTLTGPASGDPLITVYKVAPKGVPLIYGEDDYRIGEVTLVGTGTGARFSVGSVT